MLLLSCSASFSMLRMYDLASAISCSKHSCMLAARALSSSSTSVVWPSFSWSQQQTVRCKILTRKLCTGLLASVTGLQHLQAVHVRPEAGQAAAVC